LANPATAIKEMPMYIQLASLCDYAAEYNGKLCVMGTFDSIYARAFPVAQSCHLAARICFEPEDEGEQSLSIRLTDSDGENVFDPIEPKVQVKLPEGLPFLTRNMVLNFAGLSFQKSGQYALTIKSGDELLASLPLLVLQVKTKEDAESEGQAAGADAKAE
jgi:hypothetical protein